MIVQRLLTPQTALENQLLQQSDFDFYPINPREAKRIGTDGLEFIMAGSYICNDQQLTALNKKLTQARKQQGSKNE